MASDGRKVTFQFMTVRISLHLFRIVTSVTPAILETSRWRTFWPSNIEATYRYAAAIPFGALPSAKLLFLVFSAISKEQVFQHVHLFLLNLQFLRCTCPS